MCFGVELRVTGRVDHIEVSTAAEGDVAEFSVQAVGGVHERCVAGEALCLVDRHRVAVRDVTLVDVPGQHSDPLLLVVITLRATLPSG